MQLSWIPAHQLLTVELHWAEKDNVPDLHFGRHIDRTFESIFEEVVAEKVP